MSKINTPRGVMFVGSLDQVIKDMEKEMENGLFMRRPGFTPRPQTTFNTETGNLPVVSFGPSRIYSDGRYVSFDFEFARLVKASIKVSITSNGVLQVLAEQSACNVSGAQLYLGAFQTTARILSYEVKLSQFSSKPAKPEGSIVKYENGLLQIAVALAEPTVGQGFSIPVK